MRAFLAAVAVTLAVAGCGRGTPSGTADTSPSELSGRSFLSVSVTEGGAPRQLAGPQPIRLSFEKGRIAASPGCNSLGGGFRLDGDHLLVEDLAMTEMACEDPTLMDQDRWFADLLLARPTVQVTATELTLTGGDTTIVFTDQRVAEPDRPLAGTWTLTGLIDGETASSAPAGVTATVAIGNDAIEWNVGCDGASAPLEVAGSTLVIGPARPRTSDCQRPPPETDAAATSLARTLNEILEGTVSYRIDGPTLTLTKSQRAIQLRSS
jgi:heat shock protein HslJ